MELPEQDRQALIEAARRRGVTGKGGAAFGVMPSSGKRAEKLNASRDVNMPAQLARGWVAGTLGLPGDIEALGRMGINFAFGPGGVKVPEEPALPTSEFYQEWLPGGDERPAAKFASGLGALTGGMGSTTLARGALKGAKAAGKALGPKAAEMAEGYLLKSGLAPSVIKPKGGNWLSGSVEGATKPLVPKPGARGRPASETMQEMEATYPPDVLQRLSPETAETVNRSFAALKPDVAVEDWINTKLNKYIKNEMGTPEDPVRALAERGVLHVDPGQVGVNRYRAPAERNVQGYPRYGVSEAARAWEDSTDVAIKPWTAGEISQTWPKEVVERDPWLAKVDPGSKVYEPRRASVEGLGFDHLIDELRNATRADSDLPANLRWKPEDLKKVTMAQAVERVAKINEWRAAQKAEADAAKARNPATFTYKEYPEKGMQWVQLKAPSDKTMPLEERKALIKKLEAEGRNPATWPRETLEEALKYEGDVMGHCVGGYCPDVESGKSRIYSLRDKKGEPHVTIEVEPGILEGAVSRLPKKERDELRNEIKRRHFAGREPTRVEDSDRMFELVEQEYLKRYGMPPDEIIQIKGKGNRAPKEEYLPMVQDFVKSGKWGSIGDYKNTKLRERAEMFDAIDLNKLKAAGHDVPEHLTPEEAKSFADKLYTIETGKNPETGQAYAKGGLVTDTDAIAAKLKSTGMDDEKAFMQALRMADARQEAHMAGGGLAKLLKGAKTIGNYQALPLKLPRAPNLPPQEITKTAERVARQQMGQHVRQSDKIAANLAGRSVKEADKLQKMQVDIQPTKEVMQSAVVPEEVGQVRIALPGDISVADQMLMEVEGLPIGSVQEGGAKYGLGKQDLDDPRFWASNEGPAQIFQNKVTDLANMYETPEILAQHLAMGHDAMNFAQHFADANLLAIQASNVHPKAAEMFNKMIREGYEKINPKTKEKVRITFPDFPGIEDYQQAYKATQENPELRKWFNDRMKKESITAPLGIPSGKEIEYAIMEPSLRNMEHSMTGLSVGRMKPGASLIPGSSHKTYSHDIAGQALGHTKELTPIELAFPDASAHIKATKRPQDFTPTIQKLFPHQVVDDQYINQLGEYYNRLKQIRGYKKGGEVKKSGLSVLNKAII
jgi:hypothetical protein